MPRRTLSLNFGGGIDRRTGIGAVEPDAMYDLRNVYLFRGRTILRRGLARVLDIGWGSDIIGIFSVRAQGLAAILVYDDVSGDVRLYLVDGTLASASLVGTVWSGIAATATTPPIVSGDDLYNKLVLAHAEPIFAQRKATRVFDVTTFALSDLTSDLDRSGVAETVKFFGVKKHLNSLLGWGYGHGGDEDSPHTLRISKPGAPTTFVPESYLQIGSPGDPILDCAKAGGMMEIYKAKEAYVLKGNGPKTWDFDMVDDNYGLQAPKLCVTVVDTAYRWSLDGPRASRASASEDLEMPLNLAGPLADAIADEDEGFAYYDATENEVVFVFGPWAYVLHLKDGRRRWSFREYGVWLQSAGRIHEGGSASLTLAEAVIGAPSEVLPAFAPGDNEPSVAVPWTIVGSPSGGEQVEVWAKANYGTDTWQLLTTVPAADLTATVTLPRWLTAHTLAVRITVSGTPGAGYTGPADLWPATAKASFTPVGNLLSVLLGDWARQSATQPARKVAFAGPGMEGVHPELTYQLEASTDAGGSWGAVTDSPFAAPGDVMDKRANADVNTTTVRYRLTVVGPDASSNVETNVEGDTLFQPKAPFNLSAGADLGGSASGHIHHVDCSNGEASGDIDVKGRHLPNGTFTFFIPSTPGVGVDLDVQGGATLGTPGVDDGNLELTARVTITAFGVDDRTSTAEDMGIN